MEIFQEDDDAGKKEILTSLRAMLEDWFVQYADPKFDGTHEPVTGLGQIYLAGSGGCGALAFEGKNAVS